MWFLLKLIMSAVAIVGRFIRSHLNHAFGKSETIDGVPCNLVSDTHKGRVIRTRIGVKFESKVLFKITKESSWDQLFKSFGLANEIQTGDQNFDSTYYIASDSSAFRHEICQDPEARQKIGELFGFGCEAIWTDGQYLLCSFPGSLPDDKMLAKKCVSLYKQIKDVDEHQKSWISDPYAWRMVAIEAFIWGLATYAVTGFIQWTIERADVHLSQFLVIRNGLLLGLIATVVLFLIVVVLMRGSSRGHRILVESAFVLGLSLPIGGIGALTDINTYFDKSEPILVEGKAADVYRREHRGKRGRRYYSYHLVFLPAAAAQSSELEIPRDLTISRDDFDRIRPGNTVQIEVGLGYLGYPWIRRIN